MPTTFGSLRTPHNYDRIALAEDNGQSLELTPSHSEHDSQPHSVIPRPVSDASTRNPIPPNPLLGSTHPHELQKTTIGVFEIGDSSSDDDDEAGQNQRASLDYSRPPDNYYCPLTLQLMEDPVNDSCGHCFERDAITSWLEYHSLCPISRKPLDPHDLRPSAALQQRIRQWKENHPSSLEESSGRRASMDAILYPSEGNSHSRFELMLLPQERAVLSAIQLRRRIRQAQQQHAQCLRSTAIAVALGLLVWTVIALGWPL